MLKTENRSKARQRRLSIRLLSILLLVFLLVLSGFLFLPDVLRLPLFVQPGLTVGMVGAFLFLLFIIVLTYFSASVAMTTKEYS